MKLFKIIVIGSILLASLDEAAAQSVTSENLVNIHNLNTSEISSLVAPSKGSLVYNTDSNKLFVFDGSIWMATATVDTTSLSNRINQRVSYSDTASMLIGYVRKSDTASMLSNYINSASNGLSVSGKDVRLGGNLTAATTITNNSNALTIATGGSALNVTGLTAGAATDSLLTINTTTGRVNRVAPSLLNKVDSTTASNGITLTGKDVRLGGNLTAATTITNNSNALTIATGGSALNVTGLTAGTATDSLLTINTTTGRVNRVAPSLLNKVDSTTASNGITLSGKDVRLGGNLTGATSITTTGVNTLALGGLQSGTTNDSLVVVDASSGILKRVSSDRLNKVDSTTASNGITLTGKDVRLGGNLTAATTITNNSNALTIATGGSALNVTGLTAGAATDSLLTINTTTGRVNRVAPSLLNKVDSTTASNGITLSGKDVRLGGALTASTTITTDATNTLLLAGLQSGSLNDSVVMITSGNVLRRINSTSIALEPFNVLGGSTKASTNTQNIFTQGDLSIGKTTSTATLDVGGKIKADSNISAPNFSSTYQDFGSAGGTINWNMQSGATAGVRLTSNGTLNMTNVERGMYGLIRVTQDGTGGRTIALPSGSRVINGGSGVVTLTQTANAVDILTFFYDGTNYWWTIGNNYN